MFEHLPGARVNTDAGIPVYLMPNGKYAHFFYVPGALHPKQGISLGAAAHEVGDQRGATAGAGWGRA